MLDDQIVPRRGEGWDRPMEAVKEPLAPGIALMRRWRTEAGVGELI
jgi:hypothetical protein